MNDSERLLTALNAFDPDARRKAFEHVLQASREKLPPTGTNVNMHLHSFFSYNAAGWSPSRLVWEAHQAGLYAAGLCDFDVVDGLEEFLECAALAGLRGTVNVETRVYIPELAAVDINSPGEPGVAYIMGGGFFRMPSRESSAGQALEGYRARAGARNESLIARINTQVPEIAIDYAKDVQPLTPSGNATERHIVRAYVQQAQTVYPELTKRTLFWARVLDRERDVVATLQQDIPAFEEAVRSRFAKRGGLGYEQPSPGTFPGIDAFVNWVLDCGAMPLTTWLDGTNPGEADAEDLLDLMTAKGCVGVNIIPDRNWNVSDPDRQRRLVDCLDAFVAAAVKRNQPVNIGTEMNKDGLPFYDDLDGPVLKRYRECFLAGAAIMTGHTILGRYADCPYTGPRAQAEFGLPADRNRFFESVGRLPPLTADQAHQFIDMGPEKTYAALADAVHANT